MVRHKKPKKPKNPKPSYTVEEAIKKCNELHMALMVRNLNMVFGFGQKRLYKFCEGYLGLIQEVHDGRCTIKEFVQDTKEMTGIDVEELIQGMYPN